MEVVACRDGRVKQKDILRQETCPAGTERPREEESRGGRKKNEKLMEQFQRKQEGISGRV